jgi:hypothetical protein
VSKSLANAQHPRLFSPVRLRIPYDAFERPLNYRDRFHDAIGAFSDQMRNTFSNVQPVTLQEWNLLPSRAENEMCES